MVVCALLTHEVPGGSQSSALSAAGMAGRGLPLGRFLPPDREHRALNISNWSVPSVAMAYNHALDQQRGSSRVAWKRTLPI